MDLLLLCEQFHRRHLEGSAGVKRVVNHGPLSMAESGGFMAKDGLRMVDNG